MWFPQNPKVLVVDDKYDEVKPLLRVFSQNGISYIYFDGKMDSIPEKPFSSIRFVILDIDLEERTSGLNEKSKASALAEYLNQLMTIKNSPYVILFWTKHEEIIENIISYLTTEGGAPVVCKNLEKPSDGEISLEYVKEKIFADLNNDAFEFLLQWEENIANEISSFANDFSEIICANSIEKNTSWNDSLKSILSKLACTYAGTNKIDDTFSDKEMLFATKVLNQSFSENLNTTTKITFSLPKKSEITLETIAKLNTILFIESINDSIIENGKIYFEENRELHNLLKEKILTKQGKSTCQCQLVSVILTPSCDLAHKKFLRDREGSEYHRVLMGLKICIENNNLSCFEHNASLESNKKRIDDIISLDENFMKKINECIESGKFTSEIISSNEDLEKIKSKIKTLQDLKKKIKSCISGNKPENLYITQPFMDENKKISIFVFHFGTIKTLPINPEKITFSYLMKNSLISDLQTKLANHVNRLGNSMLEY